MDMSKPVHQSKSLLHWSFNTHRSMCSIHEYKFTGCLGVSAAHEPGRHQHVGPLVIA